MNIFVSILRILIRVFLISPIFFTALLFSSIFYYVFTISYIYLQTHKNYLDPSEIFAKDTILYMVSNFKSELQYVSYIIAFSILVYFLMLIYSQKKKEKKYYEVHLADISKIWVNNNRKIIRMQEEFKYLCLSTSITSVETFVNAILRPAVQSKDITYADALIIDSILFAYIQCSANTIPSVEGNQKENTYSSVSQSNKNLTRYDILKEISLIDHVVNVVFEINENKDRISDLGTCIIAALSHDIGKIPLKRLKEVYGDKANDLQGIYTRSHEERGSVVLDFIIENSKERELKIANYDNLKIVKFVIEQHHADRLDSLTDRYDSEYIEILENVVKADREARIKEEKNYIVFGSKALHKEINETEKSKITITTLNKNSDESKEEKIDYSKLKIIDTQEKSNDNDVIDNSTPANSILVVKDDLNSVKEVDKDDLSNGLALVENDLNNSLTVEENNLVDNKLMLNYPFYKEIYESSNNRAKLLISKIDIDDINNEDIKKKMSVFKEYECVYAIFNDNIKNNACVKFFKKENVKSIVFKISDFEDTKEIIDEFVHWNRVEDKTFIEFSKNKLEKIQIQELEKNNTYREFEYEQCFNSIFAKLRSILNTEDAIYCINERLYFIKYEAIVNIIKNLLQSDKYLEKDYSLLANYFIKRLCEDKYTKYINTNKNYYYTTQFQLIQNQSKFDENYVPVLAESFKISFSDCKNNHKNSNNRFLKIERKNNENN